MGTSRQTALAAARICEEKKASDIAILDLRELTYFTDFFVICSTESERQSKAIAEELEATFKRAGIKRVGTSGAEAGQWILTDFADVVCHIFLKSARQFYDLESLWGEAPRLPFSPKRRRSRKSGEVE